MSELMNKVYDLLDEAEDHEDGPVKVSITEEAVRLADESQDEVLAYEARMDLIRAATFGGYPEKAMVAFTWCVGKSTEDPDRFPARDAGTDLLWAYKWISGQLAGYPQISRAQIREIMDDMEEKYRAHSLSLRPIYENWAQMAMDCGDPEEEILRHMDAFQAARRDGYANCAACERNFQVTILTFLRKDQEALDLAEPLLNGQEGCAEVPHGTYATVLLPLLRMGDPERAQRFHKRGYEMIRGNRD
jgi:hypothetical protein